MTTSKGSSRDSARFVSVFQKAHSHVATLQRIDDQISALFEQRRKSLEELKAVQAQINSEFHRVYELDRVMPGNLLDQGEVAEESLTEADPLPETRDVKSSAPSRLTMMQATGL